jgi:hypothetical protein
VRGEWPRRQCKAEEKKKRRRQDHRWKLLWATAAAAAAAAAAVVVFKSSTMEVLITAVAAKKGFQLSRPPPPQLSIAKKQLSQHTGRELHERENKGGVTSDPRAAPPLLLESITNTACYEERGQEVHKGLEIKIECEIETRLESVKVVPFVSHSTLLRLRDALCTSFEWAPRGERRQTRTGYRL